MKLGILFWALFCFLNISFSTDTSNCTGNWELFSSEPYNETAFPETNVVYWRYRFEVPTGSNVGVKAEGLYPYSRYLNFNVYNQETMDSTGTLPDYLIEPNAGDENPFREGVSRDTLKRNYTVYFLPNHFKSTKNINFLKLPAEKEDAKLQRFEVWYRIYLPNKTAGSLGNVPLPTLTAYDFSTGDKAICPKFASVSTSVFQAIGNLPPIIEKNKVRFFRPSAHALYANGDVRYVSARLTTDSKKVAVIRFKTPSYQETSLGGGVFNSNTDVRYWSICTGGLSTKTADCVYDEKFKLDKNGYVTIIVGWDEARKLSQKYGLNHVDKGYWISPLIIYRNLITRAGYPGHIEQIPKWVMNSSNPEKFTADAHIGDYAPKGVECTVKELEKSLAAKVPTACGIPLGR